ncbi:2-oxoglutarate dehydrogenase complex dihydrolipoyllysine-residue succinyltransferase [Wolbachia endosymbiont of Howardula sp.]|uniref:2-oxoglutarate dehydrogenase complex dihydrolipoyllysine-residue succinyltransferase n=1 Tax=Wolbachia endosymbiont of Howardula sp. TaxID=2916816 RepID=UPI00217DFA45|nr:2-oxoglutarate dehydrogenase complex dihydrolipoyllysine-residue succinyltransferase [Wolbachia endosymbiont of Howardula sp.]UWI83007.1 2-oxoglutarate dehydrogenase complex dihydrolipoyllysine-residue succinyltransferase [Wolbachia endosymbiont of Howardula sp.]
MNINKTIEICAPNTLGGESITEGIIKIKTNIGAIVKLDELIFEIETDKTALELTAEVSGKITKIFVEEEEIISPGQILAILSVEEHIAENTNEQEKCVIQSIRSSPAASKIIQDTGINAESIKGTGIDKRITKANIIDYINTNQSSLITQNLQSVKEMKNNHRTETRVKMSPIRKIIASRLKDSQNTAAILTTFNEINMTNVIDLRAKYNEVFEKKYGVKLGFMSFFIKAVIQSLKEIPEINAEIIGDDIIYKHYYDIGCAVSTDKGLVVPVIRNAHQMSFSEIELTIANLSKKARIGKLQVLEMKGATFTISNGGIYGSLLSTPIINPPQSGILGMHAIQKRPVAVNNDILIKSMMYVALSYDHRIVDGQNAVTFLVKIKNYIEDPNRLLLEV